MRVMTWNINSVRLRLPLLEQLAAEAKPDIICLQETKVEDGLFPAQPIKDFGYQHQAFAGMKSYNGVAILSRRAFAAPLRVNLGGKDDSRHIGVRFDDGLEIHNFYVPAGGDIPDPALNEKFAHKLSFIGDMASHFPQSYKDIHKDHHKMILVGDLNIAPLEKDVWSHKQLLDVVSHTPVEVDGLNQVMKSFDWQDIMRKFVPEDEKLYSWWSYRGRDWEKSDRGRRLDHIWATPAVAGKAKSMAVLKKWRGAERPSDHAPVIADFDWF